MAVQSFQDGVPALTDSVSSAGMQSIEGARPGSQKVVYDITRLVTRALNPSPNGIDRIDFALARHFLGASAKQNEALICTCLGLGLRLAPASVAAQTITDIETYWNEFIDPQADEVYEALVTALTKKEAQAPSAPRVKRGLRADIVIENWRAVRQWAFRPGRSVMDVPEGAIYFNASQFLLDKQWVLHWLDRRRDVKPVFFVHDLLPIDYPEFFRPAETAQHLIRMRNICRYGAGVIVGSQAVARRLQAFAAENGRPDMAICVARPPVSPAFEAPTAQDPRLDGINYFVVCGTIEPRKNHLMLLKLWRELASRGSPPKLVIVGKRGWLNENVLDLLNRSRPLRPCVIEAGGLSTPGLRRLMSGARALLMPSFAEGFGLPIAEAMAAKVPVIASDIEVFREIGGDALEYVDPLDGLGWLAAVEAYAKPDSARRREAIGRLAWAKLSRGRDFLARVDEFLTSVGRTQVR
jgi:glycosyltransferase involved in cell wall biosynthesis